MAEYDLSMKPLLFLLLLSVLSFAGCEQKSTVDTSTLGTAEKLEANGKKIDACKLLTNEEVAAVQSSQIIDARSSDAPDGTLLVSQCYYSAKESASSVSFAVTQNGPAKAGKDEVAEYWKQTFGSLKGDEAAEKNEVKEKKGGDGEENEKGQPPQEIDGLGDGAYWAANRFGGALYVLRKQAILRISVGGAGDSAAKLLRSKALAEKALGRL
jgi:hypothetical protein